MKIRNFCMERCTVDRVNSQMTKEKFWAIYKRPSDNSLIFRELLEMKGKKAKCSTELTKDMSKQITGK